MTGCVKLSDLSDSAPVCYRGEVVSVGHIRELIAQGERVTGVVTLSSDYIQSILDSVHDDRQNGTVKDVYRADNSMGKVVLTGCEVKDMTNQEKIDLLNTIHGKVEDWINEGSAVGCIILTLDDEVRNVLYQLGKDDDWINENSGDDGETVDIAEIGYEISRYWSVEDGFHTPLAEGEVPE